MSDDTSWLDLSTDVATAKTAPPAATPPAADDDWLNIEDPNAGKTTLAFQHMVDSCMRGTDRVMACDGRWLAYRPYNREKDKETNPRTRERMEMHLAKGWLKYLSTHDEVQIFELLPIGNDGKPNPLYHATEKKYTVGVNVWADIRQAARLALARNWPEYHDFLGGMAMAAKGGGRDPVFARAIWNDTINHVMVTIQQMSRGNKDAPTEREINEGFVGVRRARGIQGQNGVVLLNSNTLQKVAF